MQWSFAKVNGRLAEIFFEKGKKLKILGHCYVRAGEYEIKKEKRMIAKDIKKVHLSYKKGEYRRLE